MLHAGSPWTRFTISVRRVGKVPILDLDGPFGAGEGLDIFRDWIDKLLREESNNLVVNLGKVPYMDSSGIGVLVGAHTEIEEAGGKCKFFGALPRVLNVLKITRVDTVLDLHKDEASALSSF